ncbi:MAG: addiction module toxin RelE [Lachnospiraceae bacterium]|nr:addiction module toxin RelE [Lachnospiraceae bacterium]
MELNEMEKRMLYQTEGSERYAILHELAMASRYAQNSDRRKAADRLIKKLNALTDDRCMEIVRDIRRNYRLPKGERTVGEMLAEARQRSGAEQLKEHDILALERFEPEVRHIIIFEVLSGDSFAGSKGDRMRQFLTDAGYQKFQDRQEQGEIRIEDHAKVTPGGHLCYDHSRDKDFTR